MNHLISMLCDDEGATLVEYALIISLIALVCIAALLYISKAIQGSLSNAAGQLQ